jgi:hypothetical protein
MSVLLVPLSVWMQLEASVGKNKESSLAHSATSCDGRGVLKGLHYVKGLKNFASGTATILLCVRG